VGNLGLGELLVIALIALLVFGPNRLPEIMRSLGKAWRTFQHETQKATNVLRESFDEVDQETPTTPGIVEAEASNAKPSVPAVDGKANTIPRSLRKYEDT
jgi:TatA/E family protein of Tat protein translocase